MESQSVGDLEEESRTDVMDEDVRVAEVLLVVIVLAHQVRTIVIICHAVHVGIGIVDGDAYVVYILGLSSGGLHQVVVCEHLIFLQSVGTQHLMADGVVVGIVAATLLHGDRHLVDTHLHGGQAVFAGKGRRQVEHQVARVGSSPVGIASEYLVFRRDVDVLQQVELRRQLTRHVGTGLRVSDFSQIAGVGQ